MTLTIQNVIDRIRDEIKVPDLDSTVDTIKAGDTSNDVTGIISTFMATHEVVVKAIDLGANFIISHEPVYYSHEDKTEWLKDDSVYKAKRKLIDDHNITIWRFHDYWHRYVPDGIVTGMCQELGWEDFNDKEENRIFHLPKIELASLAAELKDKLKIEAVRIVGNPKHICKNLAFMVGSSGVKRHVNFAKRDDIDTLICGEISEWETSEYFRDAIYQGRDKALIVTGHVQSEEAGMKYFMEWLRPLVPEIPITHIATGTAFSFL